MNDKKPINKGRVIWVFILFIIISLAVFAIGYMLYERLKPEARQVGINDFQEHVIKALRASDDGIFIKSAKQDWFNGQIYYVLSEGGVDQHFVARVGRENAQQWFDQSFILNQALKAKFSIDAGDNHTTLLDLLQKSGQTVVNGGVKSQISIDALGIPSNKTPFWESLLLSLLPLLIWIVIGWWLFRSISRGGNMVGMVGENRNPAQKINSKKKFDDIAGNKEAIEEIREIVDYLKNPKKYACRS